MRPMNPRADLPPPYSSLDVSTSNIAIMGVVNQSYEADDEAALLDNTAFEDKTTRIAFIQKVLATKLLQLFGMCAVMGLFVANSWDFNKFMNRGNNLLHLYVLSNLVFMLSYAFLVYCSKVRRTNPYRYLCLVVYPLSLSVFISTWTVYWEILASILLSCIYYCVFVFILLMYSIFACQTILEFLPKHGILAAIVTQFVMYLFTVPFLDVRPMFVLYPSIILLLEYVYIVYDLEAMTSPTYWNTIKPDDFIDGALIMNIDYFSILYNSKIISAIRERYNQLEEYPDV